MRCVRGSPVSARSATNLGIVDLELDPVVRNLGRESRRRGGRVGHEDDGADRPAVILKVVSDNCVLLLALLGVCQLVEPKQANGREQL